jgi:hypothetical protein
MRPNVPEKLLKITSDIAECGSVPLTRLTVMKKWFERSRRLSAFGLWVAARASARKGQNSGEAAQLFKASRALLSGLDKFKPRLERAMAETLHDRLHEFQNEYDHRHWGSVRIIHNWNLLLVEKGLAVYLWHAKSPAHGYKLAANYCQNYDPSYGNGLNGPSATKIKAIVRFLRSVERLEESGA